MTARDELRGTLANTVCNASNYTRRAQPYLLGSDMSTVLDKTADAILAAGYRKPRTITTAEELDALPDGSIVRDAKGFAWQKYRRPISQNPAWFAATRDDDFYNSSDFIDANRTPISVLWEQS